MLAGGRVAPLPDWITYLRAADRLGCSPWDLTEAPVPRHLWIVWGGVLAEADAIAAEQQADRQRWEAKQQQRA